MSLTQRTNLANSKNVDAYISVHYNAFDGSFGGANPEGFSVHVYPGAKGSRKLAESIIKYLKQGTKQKNRGIKENNFHVLRETKMIAVLSENGFMDNKREALLMVNVDFQKEVAREHAKGICDYFGVKYVAEKEPTGELTRVQTGAFKNKSNAIDLSHELKKDGFDTYIIKADNLYKVQVGAFVSKANARKTADKLKKIDYPVYLTNKGGNPINVTPSKPIPLKVGDKVKIKKGARTFEGKSLANFVYNKTYEVIQINSNRIVVGTGHTVIAAVHKNDLIIK